MSMHEHLLVEWVYMGVVYHTHSNLTLLIRSNRPCYLTSQHIPYNTLLHYCCTIPSSNNTHNIKVDLS
jgi:hypothetical protein